MIPVMADQGGGSPEERGRRSRLEDYAEMAGPVVSGDSTPLDSEASPPPAPSPEAPEQPHIIAAASPDTLYSAFKLLRTN